MRIVEPDAPFFGEAIHGLRVWRVVDNAPGLPLLSASTMDQVWPPDGPLRATCARGARVFRGDASAPPHLAPHPDCSCGIYAHHPGARNGRLSAERALMRSTRSVVGVVAAWGRIEVHKDGFRAEHALPVVFFSRSGRPSEPWVRRAAAAYGARVVEVPDADALRRFLATEVRGISPRDARELVVGGLDIRLAPAMDSFVGERNELVAAGGYRLDPDGPLSSLREERDIPGLMSFPVAGVHHHEHALQSVAFTPGRNVRLLPEPDNPADPQAVAVWDERRRMKVGYVPRDQAKRVNFLLRDGCIRRALVVWQYRGMDTGRRSGLRVMTSPTERIRILRTADCRVLWMNNDDFET